MGTINFVLIGARNTGKTCYLTALASHCPGISTADDNTLSYINMQKSLLEKGELPQATASSMRELFFRLKNEQHKVDFSIDDYDGSFIESLSRHETEDDASREELKSSIQESEGLLFFMPYETTCDSDVFSSFESEVNTIISLVEEITQGRYASLPIPAVVCISKWDRSPAYQQQDEAEAALTFLNDNPYYKRVYEKIQAQFEHVTIQPISAFGATEDSIHPVQGKLTPYQLEAPLKYCLDKTFLRFEERIADFQKNEDEITLFSYLDTLYDDLKHHTDGKYCRLYDEMEQRISSELLQRIESKKQTELTPEQTSFVDCIRNNDMHDSIEVALKCNESKRKSQKTALILGAVVLIVSSAIGGTYVIQNQSEQNAYASITTVINNEELPIDVRVKKSVSFIHHWKQPMGLPLQAWFSKDVKKTVDLTNAAIRKSLDAIVIQGISAQIDEQELINQVNLLQLSLSKWDDQSDIDRVLVELKNKKIRKDLSVIVSIAQRSQEPDEQLLHRINALKTMVEESGDHDLNREFQQAIPPILNSYQLLEALRTKVGTGLDVTLSDYHDLKDRVLASAVKWKEMNDQLNQLLKLATKAITISADDALTSGKVRDLQQSAEDLTVLASEGVHGAEALLNNKIQPALEFAKRQQALNKIFAMMKQVAEPAAYAKVVKDNWITGLSDDQKERIKQVLQNKYESYEDQNTPTIIPLGASDDINNIRKELKQLSDTTQTSIHAGKNDDFEYRYVRPNRLQERIDQWEKKLTKYEHALENGIYGLITFAGKTSEDDDGMNPLGFNCSHNDHDLKINIGSSITLPDDSDFQYPCSTNDDKPSLTWRNDVHLTTGRYPVNVTEKDVFVSPDTWQGSFEVTETDVFQFINHGSVSFEMGSYIITLSHQ